MIKRILMPKGGAYERELSKRLSLWWTNGEFSDVFWRTSNSGGRATIRQNQRTSNQYGDIGSTHKCSEPFTDICTIEAKRGYPRAHLGALLDRRLPGAAIQQWEQWIYKAQQDSQKAGSYSWMLITRRDNCTDLVTMPVNLHTELEKENSECMGFDYTYTAGLEIRKKPKDSPPQYAFGLHRNDLANLA